MALDRPVEDPRKRKIRTATPSTVREVNRSILLHVIRTHQPISRADISGKTGIFRSNVSEIVDELIAEGLVNEQRATPVGRGRVPIHLSLNDDGLHVIGVSIRAAYTSVAWAGLTGRIRKELHFVTPSAPEEFVNRLAAAVGEMQSGSNGAGAVTFRECGISVPGLIKADQGSVVWIPSLPAFSGFPLAHRLRDTLGMPVEVDNDCNLAALAEMWFSDDQVGGLNNFVFLEIGDIGVGAGIVLNRSLYQGHDSTFAGEFGHMVVDPAGAQCECGRRGCWEMLVCDRASWQRYSDAPFDGNSLDTLMAAAKEGDERAIQALERTAEYLSLGISNIVFGLNPEMVIVAGKITSAWRLIGGKIPTA
ncbi:MAG: ROK family protein, partial [Acidobacteria bacterium]|nr:ROK family protein [Acidobacteriota bacterium]